MFILELSLFCVVCVCLCVKGLVLLMIQGLVTPVLEYNVISQSSLKSMAHRLIATPEVCPGHCNATITCISKSCESSINLYLEFSARIAWVGLSGGNFDNGTYNQQ